MIEVGVPAKTNGTLVVYTMSGTEVTFLHSGVLQAGTHHYTFNAGNLPKGTYLVRMITGQGIETVKMLAQ